MKVTDISFRGRIGSFQSARIRNQVAWKPKFEEAFMISLLSVLVIGILLIIGGVELNPGPLRITVST